MVECLFDLDLALPTLGKFWIRSAPRNDGVVLGAYLNGESAQRLVGIAVLRLKKWAAIEYIFVDEEFRGQGVGTQLVQTAASLAQERGKPVIKAPAIIQEPCGRIFAHLLEKVGFQAHDTASIFRFRNTYQARQAWAEFMERKGRRICKRLEERGFRTISFAEADAELMERFAQAVKTRFPANLNPYSFLDSHDHKVVRDFSFLALKGDDPAAYILLTTIDGKTLSAQQLSVSFQYQRSEAFLLPIAALAEKAFHSPHGYRLLSAMVYNSNSRMISLYQGFLQPLAVNVNTQYFYVLPLQEGDCSTCGDREESM